jgi:hypothetical protein
MAGEIGPHGEVGIGARGLVLLAIWDQLMLRVLSMTYLGIFEAFLWRVRCVELRASCS